MISYSDVENMFFVAYMFQLRCRGNFTKLKCALTYTFLASFWKFCFVLIALSKSLFHAFVIILVILLAYEF